MRQTASGLVDAGSGFAGRYLEARRRSSKIYNNCEVVFHVYVIRIGNTSSEHLRPRCSLLVSWFRTMP